MKYFGLGVLIISLVLVSVALATNNKLNWLTQILSPGASTAGQVAGITAAGNTAFFKIGANLSVDPTTGVLSASGSTPFTFHAAEILTGVPNGTLTTFTLPFTPNGKVVIDINGQLLDPSQFSVTGTNVTFTVAPVATDNLHATGISIP